MMLRAELPVHTTSTADRIAVGCHGFRSSTSPVARKTTSSAMFVDPVADPLEVVRRDA